MVETHPGVNSDKFERQCELELEGFDLGIDRYNHNKDKIHKNPDKDNTVLKPEKDLMHRCIEDLSVRIDTKINLYYHGCNNNPVKTIRRFLLGYDPDRLAFLTIRCCLNIEKNKHLTRACVRLGHHIEKDAEYFEFQKEAPAYLSVVERNLKSSHMNHRHRVLEHAKRKVKLEDGTVGIKKLNWGDEDDGMKFHVGKFLIEELLKCQPALFKAVAKIKSKVGNPQLGLERTEVCNRILERDHEKLSILAPLVYPFIVPPKPWTSANEGGFWTHYQTLKFNLIKTRDKQTIKNAEEHGLEPVFKALNVIQATKYRINKKVLKVMEAARNSGLGKLPAQDSERVEVNGRYPLEEDIPWTDEEFAQKAKDKCPELNRWKQERSTAHDIWNRNVSKRQALIWKLKIANKFKDEEELYFTWSLDFRGRIYCVQPFINPQMDDSGKALVEFGESKPLGKHGLKHLLIHGANVYGYDKATLQDRVEWVYNNSVDIIDSADNPLDGMQFWTTAEKPFLFLAFCFEFAAYITSSKGFESRLPVQTDGTCSGLQHFSALLRDEIGGEVTNLTPTSEKADVYAEVAEIVNRKLVEERGNYAEAWLKAGVDRSICKRNVMTFCYGATRQGFSQQLIEHIIKEGIEVMPRDEFKACNYLAGVNWSAIEETLLKSVEAMQFLQQLAFFMAKSQLDIQWNTPIGLRVTQDYRKTKTKKLDTHWGGTRIQPRLAFSTKKKNPMSSKNGIAPNYIHSLDASHLMLTALKCFDQGVDTFSFIHDSFGTHACSMEAMSKVLRETFVEMYSGSLLDVFVSDVRKQIPDELLEEFEQIVVDYKPTTGKLKISDIKKSDYFFS